MTTKQIAAVLCCICLLLSLGGCMEKKAPMFDFVPIGEVAALVQGYAADVYGANPVIPGENNGLPVTEIGEAAFSHKAILTVDTGAVTHIRSGAFRYCRQLQGVTLRKVEQIGAGAFFGCRSLRTLVLPAGVQQIGDEAFGQCDSLGHVWFFGQPQVIGNDAFPSGTVLHGIPGGSVEAYAAANGYTFAAFVPESE